eukprot:12723202-Ditylum_brightwellii.AAC.1
MECVFPDEDSFLTNLDSNLLDNDVKAFVLLQLNETHVQMNNEAKEMLKHGQTEITRKKYSF